MTNSPTRRDVIVSLGAVLAATSLSTGGLLAQPDGQPGSPTPTKVGFQPVSIPDYEVLAHDRMSHEAWEFISSGCGDDITLRRNRESLTRLTLEPRVMVDVSKIDTSITLFGHELAHPILLAPTASHMLVHPEGEVATARGASASGAMLVASTASNRAIAEITAATSEPVWFQLYIQEDRALTQELVQKADAAKCRAICVTADNPVVYARDRLSHVRKEMPMLPFPNMNLAKGNAGQGKLDPKLGWKDVGWIRSLSQSKILLKGILHPDDAEEAVKCGVDGIIVSNHGGRALDSGPATIDVLPRVVDRVAGRIPVLFDGGVRRGTYILKALSIGANAVLIGRPYLFGLAVNGSDGVRHVVDILRAELSAAMALTGQTRIAGIDRSVLLHTQP